MIEWATEYWYLCVVALLIGVAIAAWIWLRARPVDDEPVREIDDRAATPLEPVRPVIEVADRVDFASFDAAPVSPTTSAAPAQSARVPDAVPLEGSAAPDRPAVAAAVGAPDDLGRIKGVGPKLVALLTSLGITRYDQIAAWTDADIAEVDRFLGVFQGRITRDAWVEQAGYLARGDTDGFSARFGALGG